MRIKENEFLECNACKITFREFNESDVIRVCPSCGSMDWQLISADEAEARRIDDLNQLKWDAKEL